MSEKIVMFDREGKSRSMRKGFCWPAFLVPTLWTLSEGLWRQCALSMLAAVATRTAFQAASVDGVSLLSVTGLLIYPSIMFVFGHFGNRWLLSLDKACTKDKRLYSPAMYLPVHGPEDLRSARLWKREFDPNTDVAYGLVEGFLGGNVEVLCFEGEFVVVVYHVSLPDAYPVSLPIGFLSTEKEVVQSVGGLLSKYLDGRSGFDRPNDCGSLTRFGRGGD